MNPWEKHALEILKRLTKREKQAYKELNAVYEEIIREIMADLSDLYAKLEKDGALSYADVQRYNDLQRFQRRIVAQVTLLGSKNREIILNLLEEGYDLSYSYMSYAIELEGQVLLAGATPDLPAILAQVWDNPIYGLALTPAQERDRLLIVRDLNSAIEQGLKDGETYGGIAREIRSVFDSSLRRSMTIARTETHRVRERATQDSSMNAHRQGVKMIKIWRNMGDERVRPGRGIGKKPSGKANHVIMEGVTVPVDQPFVMKAQPANSGMCPGSIEGPNQAENSINCRCYASRRISHLEAQVPKQAVQGTYEDWRARK